MKKWIIFLVILLPAIFLMYFGLSRDPRILPSTLLGKQAPDFTLTDIDGKQVSLNPLLGQGQSARGQFARPLVLNFWATWCPTCAFEHRFIRQAQSLYPSVGFYSILYSDTAENARSFVAQYGPAAPILLDPDMHTSIDYGVAGVPETFFIDAEGKVIDKHAGPLTPDILAAKMALIGGVR